MSPYASLRKLKKLIQFILKRRGVNNLNNLIKKIGVGIATAALAVSSLVTPALAAEPLIYVTPSNTQGWSTADTRTGGAVTIVADSSAPSGEAALQLTTDSSTFAKAQYMHAADANMLLSDVTDLSYSTKQVGASFDSGDASYQIPVYLQGGTSGFTTLVYEPYQNGDVETGVWQSWDVDAGQFWSSRSVTCSNGSITAGGGGEPFYTLSEIQEMCPEAVVLGYGVNVGSNNPSYTVETDLFRFNGKLYDFELEAPKTKRDCMNGGYKSMRDENDQPFKNQGQCVSSFSETP